MLDPDIEKKIKARFPEAVSLVVCRDTAGKVNLCPVGFFSLMAYEPKVWAIGLYKDHYTTEVINKTGEFVLCLPSIEQISDVIYCGFVSGKDVDKTTSTKLKFSNAKHIRVPIIKDSIACFECKVIEKIKVADHTVFFGEVLFAHTFDKGREYKLYNWDDKRLGTLKLGDKSQIIPYSPEGEDS